MINEDWRLHTQLPGDSAPRINLPIFHKLVAEHGEGYLQGAIDVEHQEAVIYCPVTLVCVRLVGRFTRSQVSEACSAVKTMSELRAPHEEAA